MKKIIIIFCLVSIGFYSCLIQKINTKSDCCKDIPIDSCGLFQSEFE